MTVGTLMSVFQRIDAIEARFGRTTRRPGAVPGVPTSIDFEAVLQRSAGSTAAQFDPFSEGAPDPAGALPIGALPPNWGHAPTNDIGSLLDDLGPLAAIGVRPGTSTAPGGDGSHVYEAPSSTAIVDGATVATSAPPTATTAGAAGAIAPDTPFAAEFERAGARYGVPARLLAAVGWVESRYQVDALSPDGAIGVMQIMPMTAQELGVDPHDPVDAIDGAARLLASHHRRFGSWDLALAAYHSGAGAVSRAGNEAPPRAAAYVERVRDRLEHA